MLSDARNLWQSAATALSSLNDNITSNIANALDQLDQEAEKQANQDALQQTLTNEIEEEFNTDDTADEITIYKQLLQECQLNIVDISTQSKLTLIAKEAEIDRYKALLQTNNISPNLPSIDTTTSAFNANDNTTTNDTSIQIAQLTAEKKACEESLIYIQDQLKESIQTKIELKTLTNKSIIYQNKIKNLLYTIAEYKLKYTQLEQEKNETVEQLVSEYSQLASESEISHMNNIAVINKLKLDKEEMALTIETLHHNISDFADRAASTTTTGHTSTNTASIADPPLAKASATTIPTAVPIPHDDQAAGAAPVPLSASSTALQQQQQEVKELKAKLINLQYDKKQQADEIVTLQTQLQALKSSLPFPSSKSAPNPPSIPTDHTDCTALVTADATSTSADRLQNLIETNIALDIEVSNLKQGVLRLQIEKNEAIAAGKLMRDQSKQHETQHQTAQVAYKAVLEEKSALEVSYTDLKRVLDELRDNHTSTQTLNNTALAEKEALLVTLSTTLEALQKQYDKLLHDSQHQKLLFEQTAEESATSLAAFTQIESDYKLRIEQLEASHTETMQRLQQEIVTYKENNISLTDQLSQHQIDSESQIKALTEKHANELQVQKSELEASHAQSILMVREQGEAAIKALEVRHAEELSATTSNLTEQHRIKLDHELQEHESQLQQAFEIVRANLLSEHNLALKAMSEQHQLALSAQSEALTSAYREDTALLTQRLNEEHAQAIAVMQATHMNELSALQQQFDQLTEKLKETEAK